MQTFSAGIMSKWSYCKRFSRNLEQAEWLQLEIMRVSPAGGFRIRKGRLQTSFLGLVSVVCCGLPRNKVLCIGDTNCCCCVDVVQAKLHRSKLAHARLREDKEAERLLRSRDLHVLNTNCGQEKEDFDFLKKLDRQRFADDSSKNGRRRRREEEVTDKHMEELMDAVMKEQNLLPTDTTMRTLTTLGDLLQELHMLPDTQHNVLTVQSARSPTSCTTLRPATTPFVGLQAADFEPSHLDHKHSSRPPIVGCIQVDADSRTKESLQTGTSLSRGRPPTSLAHFRGTLASARSPTVGSSSSTKRPKRTMRQLTGSPLEAGLALSIVGTRRPSRQAASVFEEEEKVDVIALRLQGVRTEDPSPKVLAFIRSMDELDMRRRGQFSSARQQGGGEGAIGVKKGENWRGEYKFDYYATKMALYAAHVCREPLPGVPGTPDDINLRLVGQRGVRSLTMPCLRLDFGNDDGDGYITDDEIQHGEPRIAMVNME